MYPYIYFFVKGLWWFLIHFLRSFVLDSKIYWLRWSWNGIGLTCWFWALKFVTLISSFFKVKKVLSNPSPICMSDEMTNKFDWSVNQENVQTCAGYCSTNPLLKYLLRWIGNKNYVAEDWNGLSLILTRNGICQTFDTYHLLFIYLLQKFAWHHTSLNFVHTRCTCFKEKSSRSNKASHIHKAIKLHIYTILVQY